MADVLAPEVVRFLIETEFLTDALPVPLEAALKEILGDADDILLSELSCCIFERIELTTTQLKF